MRSFRHHLKAFSVSRQSLWTGAALSLAAGVALYAATAATVESDAEQRFKSMARSAQYTINGRIKSYTDLLRGAAGLFQAESNVTRVQFHRYVKGLSMEEHFPGIEVINFARHITDAERPAFEQGLREESKKSGDGAAPFSINPPGRRDSYSVMTFIEPMDAWRDKLGMDLEARSFVARTLDQSRDTGKIAASGTRVAILSGPNRHGLGMRLPVYRNDMSSSTLEERRAAYLGTVGIGFGVHKLVQGVLDEMAVKGARLTVTDLAEVPSEPGENRQIQVLFDSKATNTDPSPQLARTDRRTFYVSLPIGFNQRIWQADFSVPKSLLYTRFDTMYPWLAMLAGVVTTSLLYALFQTLASSRRRALQMAQEMTRELRDSEAKLQASHQTLRRLAAHADQIKEGERKRIAREIHDDLGQNLLALRIEADMLTSRTRNTHARLHERARATVAQIDATIKSVRQIINDLRPNVLDLGLNAAVDWQVADFKRRTGIECQLLENEADLRLNDHCATAFFRILQESLSNITRHSRANKVCIELHLLHDRLSMVVSDNGIGLPPGGYNKIGSFGLVGIEERINILGGTFAIRSEPGEGTTIVVSVPVSAQAEFMLSHPAHTATPQAAPLIV